MMDLAAVMPLADAERGNLDGLVKRLRDADAPITMEERLMAADYLEGIRVKPNNRPPSYELVYEKLFAADYWVYLRYEIGLLAKVANYRTACEVNKSADTIRNWVQFARKYQGGERWSRMVEAAVRRRRDR